MEKLFSVYLAASFFGSVMILLALLLRPVLRNAPRNALCIVWLLVVMRLLVPFAPESKLSLQPQPNLYESVVTTPQPEPDDAPAPVPDLPDTPPVSAEPIPDSSGNVQKPTEPVPDTPKTEKKALEPMLILAVIWLSIAGALVHYTAVSYGILKYKVRDAVRCEDGAWECDRIRGAFLLGYLRPKIYLPLGLSRQDRKLIIAHEQVHMRRGDNWWKLLGILCVCIHWYNPLVWLAYVLMCQDMEEACDEQVIRRMPLEERKAYSYALLNSGKRAPGYFVYPVAFGEVNLKQRIKNVLSYRNPTVWITVAAVTLVIFVAVCFMTTPEKETYDTPDGTGGTQATTDGGSDETTEPSAEPTTTPTNPTVNDTPVTTPPVTVPPVTNPPITNPTTPPATNPTTPPVTNPTTPPATIPNQTPNADGNIVAQGVWGNTPVTWKLNDAGALIISGKVGIQKADIYPWTEYSSQVTKIVVEDGITIIPNYAFKGMKNVTEVYLSNALTYIGHEAFRDCAALRSVAIPASTKEIGEYAFFKCSQLTELTFAPNSQVQTIEQRAFAGIGITTFTTPASLLEIEDKAFDNCTALQTLVLNSEGLSVGQTVFSNCPAVKRLVVGEQVRHVGELVPHSLAIETVEIYTDYYGGFSNYTALKSAVIGGSVTKLGDAFFKGCTSLSDVTITASITKIGTEAFQNCKSLRAITIPNSVKEIGSSAFDGSGLVSIQIPASVTVLERYIFANCQNLQSIMLPDGLTAIEGNAFYGSGLTSITIPATVETIAPYVWNFSSIQEIVFLGDAPEQFNDMAFSYVTVTAYYPKSNPTWTEDTLKQYGGNITWIPR